MVVFVFEKSTQEWDINATKEFKVQTAIHYKKHVLKYEYIYAKIQLMEP